MKISLFTSDQPRHNYLVNSLSGIASKLFVLQEKKVVSSEKIFGNYNISNVKKKYFSNVIEAQNKIFSNCKINKKENINVLSINSGDLNKCTMDYLSRLLKSDIYIVFGSSYIKGDLVNFLIKNKAINVHMGISPYYRGTDCNFWSLYDNNSHLTGSTIHFLSKGLDSGPILYHALSEIKHDPFFYTMSTVKAAVDSITERVVDKKIFKFAEKQQDKSLELRYSKKSEFTDEIIEKFLNKKINLSKKFDLSMLKDPFFLKN